ncbi:NAD(P)-dependent oxidoreductase [Desulfosporosinus sp. Sb-LF]|uniref:NAD-dependent epimerase/dehydratase family protein n=1 Tax=Desulfosporosinus sp. Sb-LF TaxID=2560027 RepID=UPI00107F2626|nr:NAD(P)-dependent oxidoreductase [Desulfosporosinus sp. Sb-LF]TGE33789.1 NAD(P)-dependent oxidoreductase [Desulfosporosinus sp. Sb-LF]
MNDISIKIVVIGANSYIARNLLRFLDSSKYILYLYDRDDYQFDGYENYKKIDLLSKTSLDSIVFDCDLIFLFSGRTGTSQGFDDYESFIDVNEKFLLNLLTIYRQKKSNAKIILPSTRLLYQGSNHRLVENAPKEFKTIYALNKFSCEQYLKMYHDMFGVRYSVFRICLPYGTAVANTNSYGTVEFFISRAVRGLDINIYGHGRQKRTFTHIDDLCCILLMGALEDRCEGEVFNIGGADELSIEQVARQIAEKYNVSVNFVPWPEMAEKLESGDTVFDSSKLDSILKYSYQRSFEEWISVLKPE